MSLSKFLVVFCYIAASITVATMVYLGPAGWDGDVYWTAAQSLHAGGDPYAQGIAVQQAFHDQAVKDPRTHPPMTYVYSPITLPMLCLLGNLPGWLMAYLYYLSMAIGLGLQLWAGWQMAPEAERRWLKYLLPAVAFFPGLLNEDVLLSGNIAYLLYGLVLSAAVPGWKRNRWHWYYLAVLAASICKAPLLTLLALPVVLGRRQWLAACTTAAIGSTLFLAQAKLWPALFAEYFRAVQLQFDWNLDFGVSPAGLLGKALVQSGLRYQIPTTILYIAFAFVIGTLMLWTARQSRTDAPVRAAWVPVALVGTVLLNPRIKEYDVAALTIPLVLIAARMLRYLEGEPTEPFPRVALQLFGSAVKAHTNPREAHGRLTRNSLRSLLTALGWFLTINLAASGDAWKPLELSLLIVLFGMGTWLTLHHARPLPAVAPHVSDWERTSRVSRAPEYASPREARQP